MLKRTFTSLIIASICFALIISCASTSPFDGQKAYFIQALGEEGNLVAGISLTNKNSRVYSSILTRFPEAAPVLERSQRISVAVAPDGTVFGGLEGDFPKSFADSAIQNSSIKNLNLICPTSGLIIFSTGDIDLAVEKTWTKRQILIPYVEAVELCRGDMALYSVKPSPKVNTGMDLNKDVLDKISGIYVCLTESSEGKMVMYADFSVYDGSYVQSLNKVLRTIYVSDLKRDGQKPDINDLKSRFSAWDTVTMRYLTITDERIGKIFAAVYGAIK